MSIGISDPNLWRDPRFMTQAHRFRKPKRLGAARRLPRGVALVEQRRTRVNRPQGSLFS